MVGVVEGYISIMDPLKKMTKDDNEEEMRRGGGPIKK